MQVLGTSFSLEVKNILQVLDLFLQFKHKSIVSSTDLVCASFGHNLFSSIGKLQG